MVMKTVLASMARGLALAGFSLALIAGSGRVAGAEPSPLLNPDVTTTCPGLSRLFFGM